MWLQNCEMAGDIQALPTVVTGGGDLLVRTVSKDNKNELQNVQLTT